MGKKQSIGKNISDLVHIHKGLPAVVIGGAPSNTSDLRQCPDKAIYISANHHGFKVAECNYGVCCEDLEINMRVYNAPVITRHSWADYRVFDMPLPNSAILAAWSAWVMGCAPIIITGVECYQGKTYADNPNLRTSGHNITLKEHLQRWSKLIKYAPGAMFRCVSGPLEITFRKYYSIEPAYGIAGKELILSFCQGQRVEMLREATYARRTYKRGDIVEVTQMEAHAMVRAAEGRRI